MAKSSKIKVQLQLLKLTTEQFFHAESITSKVDKTGLSISNSLEYGLDISKLATGCIYKFELIKDDGNVPVLVLEVGAHFKIDEKSFDKLFDKKENTFTLPFATVCLMLSVAVGAARGFLHAKTEGTNINVSIPIFDPETIITGDLIIPISSKSLEITKKKKSNKRNPTE
ncbi:hypothetical protein KHA90_07835 [Flavobacterium psychroterrae]|uniref:Uncharacterized protein n=1 Tax=Flavobacterium psychroterrae TaxID=2133767 RepID=A0ABS5P9G0_9FLAO|nr:hypothetical protein [Flavobacterium psychroterrae]MBS7230932.1 hypothetical protein [Flavobacterium psychroterrae]